MRAEDLEPLREHMLAVIAASAFGLRDAIGKNALDERVMTAMGKVPRHQSGAATPSNSTRCSRVIFARWSAR